MKMKKIFAGISAMAIAVSTMASMSVSAMEFSQTGSKTFVADDEGKVDGSIIQFENKKAFDWASYDMNETDVITAKITYDGDWTSDNQIAFNGFTSSWGGWSGVSNADVSADGSLEITTTVKDIMTANGIDSISDLGGFIFQLWNPTDGQTVNYEITVSEAEEKLEPYKLYSQKTDVVDGKYSVRYVEMITEEEAKAASSATLTLNNGSVDVPVKVTKYYTSVSAAGETITPDEGYVFLAYAIKNVPEDVTITAEGYNF